MTWIQWLSSPNQSLGVSPRVSQKRNFEPTSIPKKAKNPLLEGAPQKHARTYTRHASRCIAHRPHRENLRVCSARVQSLEGVGPLSAGEPPYPVLEELRGSCRTRVRSDDPIPGSECQHPAAEGMGTVYQSEVGVWMVDLLDCHSFLAKRRISDSEFLLWHICGEFSKLSLGQGNQAKEIKQPVGLIN